MKRVFARSVDSSLRKRIVVVNYSDNGMVVRTTYGSMLNMSQKDRAEYLLNTISYDANDMTPEQLEEQRKIMKVLMTQAVRQM
ncbi:MAG: hypothetical protein J5742_03920 [Alphaproteobacteria bacterium]|nr:hypothetical protein [Alphaproteobacteria bacterium]